MLMRLFFPVYPAFSLFKLIQYNNLHRFFGHHYLILSVLQIQFIPSYKRNKVTDVVFKFIHILIFFYVDGCLPELPLPC